MIADDGESIVEKACPMSRWRASPLPTVRELQRSYSFVLLRTVDRIYNRALEIGVWSAPGTWYQVPVNVPVLYLVLVPWNLEYLFGF